MADSSTPVSSSEATTESSSSSSAKSDLKIKTPKTPVVEPVISPRSLLPMKTSSFVTIPKLPDPVSTFKPEAANISLPSAAESSPYGATAASYWPHSYHHHHAHHGYGYPGYHYYPYHHYPYAHCPPPPDEDSSSDEDEEPKRVRRNRALRRAIRREVRRQLLQALRSRRRPRREEWGDDSDSESDSDEEQLSNSLGSTHINPVAPSYYPYQYPNYLYYYPPPGAYPAAGAQSGGEAYNCYGAALGELPQGQPHHGHHHHKKPKTSVPKPKPIKDEEPWHVEASFISSFKEEKKEEKKEDKKEEKKEEKTEESAH